MKIFTFLWAVLLGSLMADDAAMTVGNFTFKGGEAWLEAPVTPMVKAAVTHGKEGPVLKFYHFGQGQGGGVAANLKRWKGQFQGEAKVTEEEKTYGEQKVTIVTMTGTYMDGPPFGEKVPTKGQALLGAVIPHPSGDVFLKMTGAEADITKAKADFIKLIESAFAK
ncbi:MAG: hypothetical protein QNL33_18925 [Akkermansiaceae bacterium]|jgi:hypothetical protein